MNYQQAFLQAMVESKVTISLLAIRTEWNTRRIEYVLKEAETWHPNLDTLLQLCYSLPCDVFRFFALAEFGSDGNHQSPITNHQSPITNHQSPITNHQSPGARSQGKELLWSMPKQREAILALEPWDIGPVLRALRKERGWSQRVISDQAGFSTQAISLREGKRYKNFPSMVTIERYCEVFKIPIVAFIYRLLDSVSNKLRDESM